MPNYNDSFIIVDDSELGIPAIESSALSFYEQMSVTEALIKINPSKIPLTTISISETFLVNIYRPQSITDWQFSPEYRILFDDGNGWATTTWHNNVRSYGKITKTSKHWSGEYSVGNWEIELNDPESDSGNLYADSGTYAYKSIWGSLYSAGSEARGKSVLLRAAIQINPFNYVSQFEGQIQDVTTENGIITLLIQDKLGGLNDKQFVWDYLNIGSSNGAHTWGRVKKIFGTQVMWDDYGDVEYIERKSPETTFWDTALSGIIGGAIGIVSAGFTFGASAVLGFAGGALGNLPKSSETTQSYYKYTDYNAIPDETVASGQKVKFYSGSICAIATNSNSPLKDIQEKVITGGGFDSNSGIYGTFEFADTSGINIDDWVYIRRPISFSGSPDSIVKQILCGSNINTPYNADTVYNKYGNLVYNSNFGSLWNDEINNIELLNLYRMIGVDEEISPFDLLKELFSEIKVNFYIDENNKFSCRTIRPRGFSSSGIATYTTDNIHNFQYKRSTEEVQSGFVMYYDYVGKNGAYNNEYNRKLTLNFKNPIANISKFGTINSRWIHNEEDAKAIAYREMYNTESGVDRGVLDTTLYGVLQNTADCIRVTHPSGNISNRLFEIESYSKDFTSSKVQFSVIDAEKLYGYGNCAWSISFNNVTGTSLSGYSFYGHVAGQAGTLGTLLSVITPSATTAYVSPNEIWHNHVNWYCCFGSLSNSRTEVFAILSQGGNRIELQRGLFNTIRRKYNAGDQIYSICPVSKDSDGNLTPDSLVGKFNLGTSLNINPSFGTGFRYF
jgi:hypothetical protein